MIRNDGASSAETNWQSHQTTIIGMKEVQPIFSSFRHMPTTEREVSRMTIELSEFKNLWLTILKSLKGLKDRNTKGLFTQGPEHFADS